MQSKTEKIEKWKVLNHDLYQVIEQIDNKLASSNHDLFAIIFGGFVNKAVKSLRAINVLYENNLPEEAQAMVRILFELRITFCCFLTDDPKDKCERVLDSMILEKAKQARASGFGGMSKEDRDNILDAEKVVSKKYLPGELEKIKRNGFTGMTIEQRAAFSGNEDDYNVAYRNFSRNIHSNDYLERFMRHEKLRRNDHEEYIISRDIYSLRLTFVCANEIARNANNFYRLGFSRQLEFLTNRQHELGT